MAVNQRLYDVYRTAGFADTQDAAVVEGYSQLLPLLPAPASSVLDFGCGGGEFLAYLKAEGFTYTAGIDRSGQQVERCQERGLERVETVIDSIAWLGSRRGEFAAIVMNDVLEHIAKPEIVATLEAIREALAPGGSIIIKVPNAANAFGLVARYLDFTHEVAFTEHSLQQVLLAAGYAEISVTGMKTSWRPTLRRTAYWAVNNTYQLMHRALYMAAVGADAPRVMSKLLLARAVKR